MAVLNAKINIFGTDKASGPLVKIREEATKLKNTMTETTSAISHNQLALNNIAAFKKIGGEILDATTKLTANKTAIAQHTANLKQNQVAERELHAQQKQGIITKAQAREGLKKLKTANKELNTSLNGLNRDTKKLNTTIASLTTKQQTLSAGFKEAGINVKHLAVEEKFLSQAIKKSNNDLATQQARLDQLNKKITTYNGLQHSKDRALGNIAKGAVGIYAGAAGIRKTISFIQPGIDMDKSMSDLAAVLREEKSSQAMRELAKQATYLSQTTKFTGNEVAQAQFYLGRTGYSAEQVKKAMPGMLSMAAAGDLDVATTADIASNIQTAMRIPAEDMQHVADVMTGMFTRANVDIQMLGDSLKYSAGIGASFGQSLETVVAATAMMGNAGIQGSQAGTTLRQILVRLGDSKAVKELGVITTDASGNMRDLVDIVGEISEATKTLGNVERGTINKKIAGQIGITGFDVLLSRSKELKELRGAQGKYAGESTTVASTRMDNVAGDLNLLAAAFSALQVTIFGQNQGMLRGLVQGLTTALNATNEFLKRNAWLGKTLITVAGGLSVIVTTLGALKLGFALVSFPIISTVMAVMRLTAGFSSLGTVATLLVGALKGFVAFLGANPIIATVGFLATAGYLIYQNWGEIKIFFSGLATYFKDIWDGVLTWFSDKYTAIVEGLKKGINGIKSMLQPTVSEVKSFLNTDQEDLKNMGAYAVHNAKEFGADALGIVKRFMPAQTPIEQGLRGAVKHIKANAITSSPVVNITVNAAHGAMLDAKEVASTVGNKVTNALTNSRIYASLRDID